MTERLVATADLLLAGRYRLVRVAARRRHTTVWRGADQVLARPVAIRVLDDVDAASEPAKRFLAAAMTAGRLGHLRIASVYDAAVEDGLVYVVSEWVDGPSVADLLRDGPLPAPRATTITAQIAEALLHAHDRGVHHGSLGAHQVLLCPDGRIKVTDFQVGAALSDDDTTDDPVRADTRAAAAVLYAALTARSPFGAEAGLARAPEREGRLLAPRQVRAGVPRDVDTVVLRALLPELQRQAAPITTPRALLDALNALPGDATGAPAPAEERPPPRRLVRLGVPLAGLAGVVVTGLLAGLAVGRVPGPGGKFPVINSQAPEAAGTLVRPTTVRDFDPQGDGQENSNAVPLAFDRDTSTSWQTVTYRTAPAFGNLKSGAGLLVDLGSDVTVRRLELALPADGLSLELRAAGTAGEDATAFPVVASVADGKRTVTVDAKNTRARYWLIWLTKLVPDGKGKFQGGVSEFAFYR